MEWLNYHHLYYFHVVAREGSLTRAARELRVGHSTLSAQVRNLEDFLGQPLFDRQGRRLRLTPFGGEVAQYAADIFRLGSELVDVARQRCVARRAILRVGVVGTLPRTIVYRLLEPALASAREVSLVVHQAPLEELLLLLASQRAHLVLSDAPAPEGLGVRLRTQLLGASEVLLYGAPALARRYRKDFPSSLERAPLLLPSAATALRASMDRWFADHGLRIEVAGEFDDAGLLRVFGAMGRGLFPIRAALKAEVEEIHHVQQVGELAGVKEAYYLISQDRRAEHPFVAAILAAGQARFAPTSVQAEAMPSGRRE